MKTIRIGIVGAGQNACKVHIPKLQSIAGVEILEIANRSVESGQAVAERFKIPRVRADWREVVLSKDVDAVLIGTWPYLHCEVACLALNSGKHVLCEARMSMDEEEAREMLRTSRENPRCVAQLVPSPFTLRIDKTVSQYLEQDKLGKPLYFHLDYQLGRVPPAQGPAHWRRNAKYSGKNIMVLGIAYESILRWFGPAEWASAEARVFNDAFLDPDSGKMEKTEIPDYLSVQMRMKTGVQGTFLISEAGLHAGPPSLKILGERGTLHYRFAPDGELQFASQNDRDAKTVIIPPGDEGRWRAEEEFVNCIRGMETVNYTTFETGLQYMRFTEAVNRGFKNNGARITL
ncbi:MAG: Gfo/Idh/MocA family oxidoreductase [Nitrospinae bacterium]|nr:Gfo/Idh/MocA family oxidoreductase [Nitrospinota bacterium]